MTSSPYIKAPKERFAEKHHPEVLPPSLLDAYLERGWYRMGQSIFTTHFLSFHDSILSAIWTRLDLHGYSFRKRQRKLLRRNAAQFTCIVRPAIIDESREALFQRYRAHFPADLAPCLEEYLLEGHSSSIFDTREVSIYAGNRLVGLSYFDIGVESAESIIGIYDPDYQSFSLGYYSMLLEIEYCQNEGLRYYYPGYVVPGNPRFDYKLRIGPVEYYDLHLHDWRPHEQLNAGKIPLVEMTARLREIQQIILDDGIDMPLLYNPLFEASLISYLEEEGGGQFLDFPVLLFCGRAPETARFYVLVFDPRRGLYKLLVCRLSSQLWFHFHQALRSGYDGDEFMQIPLLTEKIVAAGSDSSEFYSQIRHVFASLKA